MAVKTQTQNADPQHLAQSQESTPISMLIAGQLSALDAVYDSYANLVFSFAIRMLGEPDAARTVTRDTFLHIWQQRESFTSEPGEFVTALLSAAHTLGTQELRRRRALSLRGEPFTGEEYDDTAAPSAGPQAGRDSDDETALQRRRIRGALQVLSTEQRRTIELAYFQGYSQEELARLTGEPLSTVKSRLRLGLRKLRAILAPEDQGAN